MQVVLSVAGSLEGHLKRWPELYLAIIFILSITWYLQHRNQVLVHWPVVDMLPSLVRNAHRVHDWTVDISNTFGCTKIERGPFFARLNMLFTCDPCNIEYVVRTNFANYPKGADYNKTFDILGDGLFNVDFHLWHTQRSMARMAFTSNNYGNLVAKVSKQIVEDSLMPLMLDVARQSSVIDLEDVSLRYTFDATFTAIFGRNPNFLSVSFPRNEFAEAMDHGLEAVFYRHVTPRFWWKMCSWLNIGKERKLSNAGKTMDRHMAHYIALKKQVLLEGVETTDLLSVYLNFLQENKNHDLLSKGDKFLRDTALTFLFAGRDTTGVALSWFFCLVSKNPHAEGKILEELRLLVSRNIKYAQRNKPCVFDSDDLKGLVYLHAAVCESLRLYPSVPLNRKSALHEDVFPDGTVVKPGMTVIMSTYAMARMEHIWGKDCMEFRPERWMDENGKLNNQAMSKFFAFSIGPRVCLGKSMAFTMIKAAAAAVLFNFHVKAIEGEVVWPKSSLVIRMKNGFKVKIKERGA